MTNREAIEIITNAVQTENMTKEQDEALAVIQKAIEKLEEQQWIPIKYRATTDEDCVDKDVYPFCLECRMPDDGQEILISRTDFSVEADVCNIEDECAYSLDSELDWIDDVAAWMPRPEPYKEKLHQKIAKEGSENEV